MAKYYFTFGSWEGFPYQNTYLMVVASDYRDAVNGFRKRHPDVNTGCLNCSDCYGEKEWTKVRQLYEDRSPAEIIWTETCYGKKAPGYEDVFVFVPEKSQIVRIAEGTGDNLLPEDIGYVDYICYEQYALDIGMPEVDGGQILIKKNLREKYRCLADCIPDVLNEAYGSLIDCTILDSIMEKTG